MFLTLFGKVKKEEKLHRSMPEFLNFLFYIPLILLIYLVDVVFRVHRFRRLPWRFLVPDCHMELLTKREMAVRSASRVNKSATKRKGNTKRIGRVDLPGARSDGQIVLKTNCCTPKASFFMYCQQTWPSIRLKAAVGRQPARPSLPTERKKRKSIQNKK